MVGEVASGLDWDVVAGTSSSYGKGLIRVWTFVNSPCPAAPDTMVTLIGLSRDPPAT